MDSRRNRAAQVGFSRNKTPRAPHSTLSLTWGNARTNIPGPARIGADPWPLQGKREGEIQCMPWYAALTEVEHRLARRQDGGSLGRHGASKAEGRWQPSTEKQVSDFLNGPPHEVICH